MTRFYIAFLPPNSEFLYTIFPRRTIYFSYNYTYYTTAIRPPNNSYTHHEFEL